MIGFIRCIGEAVLAKGLHGLVKLVPFGEHLYEIADEAFRRWRERQQAEQIKQDLRQELEQAAQTDQAQFEQQMRQLAAEVAAAQPLAVRQALADYLTLLPIRIRQTFVRPEDPTGTTLPASWSLQMAQDLLPLLPPRPPRFRAGQRPPGTDKWVLVQRLGLGGFGEVWKAQHTQLKDRFSAFKFCLDPASQQRLLQHEARIINQVMTQVDHPGIVKLLEVDYNAEAPWLQYEYVAGGELGQLVAHWPRDPGERIRLATSLIQSLANTVAYCHQLQPPVVHRDLKPSNILVTCTGLTIKALKITDFGIGDTETRQALEEEVRWETQQSALLSTPSLIRSAHTPMYASPEQKKGAPAHPADDVHALGVLWYQLLLGDLTQPLGVNYREELAERGVNEEVINLLARCVAPKAEKRLANAGVLLGELRNLKAREGRRPQGSRRLRLIAITSVALVASVAIVALAFLRLFHVPTPAVAPMPPIAKETRPTAPPAKVDPPSSSPMVDPKKVDPPPPTPSLPMVEPNSNSFGMKFVKVPKGTFWMSQNNLNAQRQVTIDKDFDLGVYEVTQGEWLQVMGGTNPSWFSREGAGKDAVQKISDEELRRFPVENVSWDDAQKFLEKLNEKERGRGYSYYLPTEEEWEYACRGGATSKEECSFDFYFRTPTNDLSSARANFNNGNDTTKVGSYEPNRLGLYDMHGNVWEWTATAEASARVIRGGGWISTAVLCRAACRIRYEPAFLFRDLGLRVARVPVR